MSVGSGASLNVFGDFFKIKKFLHSSGPIWCVGCLKEIGDIMIVRIALAMSMKKSSIWELTSFYVNMDQIQVERLILSTNFNNFPDNNGNENLNP